MVVGELCVSVSAEWSKTQETNAT